MASQYEDTRDLVAAVDTTSRLAPQPTIEEPQLTGIRVNPIFISERVYPWWSRQRDKFLWEALLRSDILLSTTNVTSSRLFSIPVGVMPRDKENKRNRDLAYWSSALLRLAFAREMLPFIIDWQTQDNGAFAEIIGGGDPSGPIEPTLVPGTKTYLYGLGLRHLDSQMCLDRTTRVMLEDGSVIPIIDIVRGQMKVSVMSLGPDGNLEPKPVVGWHESRLGDRKWLRINLAHSLYRGNGRQEGITVTNDHEMLTTSGWVRAEDLTTESRIATPFPDFTKSQAELMVGTVLGDAFIGRQYNSGKSCLQFMHGRVQEEWMAIKERYLRDFTFSRRLHKTCVGTQSLNTPSLGDWREMWYPDGKKIVNRQLVEAHFGPRMLAAWYADDGRMIKKQNNWGRPGGEIAAMSFDPEDVDWLCDIMCSAGIRCKTVYSHDKRTGRTYPQIRISADGMAALAAMVGPYIPPCLRYKLPDNAPAYDPSLWEPEKSPIYYDRVISVEQVYNGGQAASFCIDVMDNHNFVAANMIVHNCTRSGDPEYPVIFETRDKKGKYHRYKLHRTRVLFTSQMPSPRFNMFGVGISAVSRCISNALHLTDISVLKEEWLGARPVSEIVFGRGFSVDDLADAFAKADLKADAEGLTRHSKLAYIGIRGAPELIRAASIERIPLKRLPEGYDEETSVNIGINIVAMGYGFDPRELWPATVRGATRADAEVSHLKTMRKTPGVWVESLTTELGEKWVPMSCLPSFDQQDDEQDRIKGELRKLRAEELQIRLESKQINAVVAFQTMLDAGDINEAQYAYLVKHHEEQEAKMEERMAQTTPDIVGSTNQPDAAQTEEEKKILREAQDFLDDQYARKNIQPVTFSVNGAAHVESLE
jgi:hypothetical protein